MIQTERLRKEYDTLVAVADLDLNIPAGEIYGLIGPNGAGKTTTIRMACGLLRPTQGRVMVNDVDVHADPERAQQFIGYLSDFFNVYEDLTVWEYLDYFARAYRMVDAGIPARIDEVIADVGLEVKRDALIRGLSRGMKQRLGIGRAIIHRPRILLLDEPASGLDPKARLDLRTLLKRTATTGTTVLISSHILPDLEGFCTMIGIMEKGRMVRSGYVDQIARDTVPARLVRMAWAGDGARAAPALQQAAHVSNVVMRDDGAQFEFAGSEQDLAELLRALVGAGVPVTWFGEVKRTVEELYVKISHNEVM